MRFQDSRVYLAVQDNREISAANREGFARNWDAVELMLLRRLTEWVAIAQLVIAFAEFALTLWKEVRDHRKLADTLKEKGPISEAVTRLGLGAAGDRRPRRAPDGALVSPMETVSVELLPKIVVSGSKSLARTSIRTDVRSVVLAVSATA